MNSCAVAPYPAGETGDGTRLSPSVNCPLHTSPIGRTRRNGTKRFAPFAASAPDPLEGATGLSDCSTQVAMFPLSAIVKQCDFSELRPATDRLAGAPREDVSKRDRCSRMEHRIARRVYIALKAGSLLLFEKNENAARRQFGVRDFSANNQP